MSASIMEIEALKIIKKSIKKLLDLEDVIVN